MVKIFKHPVLLETACGHDGSEKVLKKLTDIAINVCAKQIKYQLFNIEERALPNTKEDKIFKPLCLEKKIWDRIIKYAQKNNLKVFADVYGNYSFNLAKDNSVDGYKIHSEDFFNSYFIEKAINTNKPTLINLGGTYKSEVFDLMNFLKKKKRLNKKIVLMHGVQTFPTPSEGHSLYEFNKLIQNYKKWDVSFGYSDHIDGSKNLSNILPILAYSLGADVIEKHFTDDRKYKRTDYQSALDKDQIKKFLQDFDFINKSFKESSSVFKFENIYRNMFKKSCAFKINKNKNEKIEKTDLKFVKSNKKKSYFFSHNIVGKKINKFVPKNTIVSTDHLVNKVGAIITVRTSSNRYPQKALKKINNIESIKLVIRRIKKLKNINDIILATSTHKSDNVLVKIAKQEGIKFFRGSLNNVVNRYYTCAKNFGLDYVVRVTGDAVLCDEQMLDKAILSHLKTNADVTFIKNMPYGTAKEVISIGVLKTINDKSINKNHTEYLEFFLENKKYFKINYVKSNYRFNKDIRLTLDFKEDRVLFDKIYRYFNDKQSNFTLKDVIVLLKSKPHLIKINSFLKPKFDKKEINTELKI
jgi:spore coat polysaccharide biosynthesis protein SpsF (cytidylyltransferase family)/sialic acid synthase SpsE